MIELSVIITAHNEGLLGHKTIRSVLRALEEVESKHEIIINLDKPDSETKKYFKRYENQAGFVVTESSCGDTGGGRNAAIKHAKGKYVIFLDADDLVSKNYFSGMLKVMKATNEEVLVHPQYCFAFEDCGDSYCLQEMQEASATDYDIQKLFGRHRWISSVGGQRKTFTEHPYIRDKDGFGHEDYVLAIELTNEEIEQKVAPHTVHFYRRRPGSQLSLHNSTHVTQPANDLFAIERWRNMAEPKVEIVEAQEKASAKQRMKNLYVWLRNRKIANTIIEPVAVLAKKVSGKKLIQETSNLPEDFLQAWKEIASIEMQLYPITYRKNRVARYSAENGNRLGEIYWKLCQQVRDMPDYIFVVPWIVSGGADKVLLNYLEAIKELFPQWKVAVITTLPEESTWKDRVPDNAYVVDFGNTAAGFNWDDQDILFTRLMLQLKCKYVHIIHSVLAFNWMVRHPELIRAHFQVTASLFCNGVLPGTDCEGLWSFADPHAARVHHLLAGIFTDNAVYIDELVRDHGFDREKIKVHYQPTKKLEIKKRDRKDDKKIKVLWAGRISLQKNPKLLVRIAEKLDPEKVQIEAFGRIDKDEREGFEFPNNLSILTYHGEFSDFTELKPGEYDLLLYTAKQDGMPNIILEAASAELPAIASNVGGISDFVQNEKTGFLVNDADNEDEYVAIINRIVEDPSILTSLARRAKELVDKRHGWENFLKVVREDLKH